MAEWNDKLITRERALEIAGAHPVLITYTHGENDVEGGVYIRCAEDGKSCGRFNEPTSAEDILSAVLSHMVHFHGAVLSGRGRTSGRDNG